MLVDSGSSDRTREIASAHCKVRFLDHPWEGFPIQWNIGIDLAAGEWILISEADHRVSQALRREIEDVLDGLRAEEAFLIPRHNYLFGKWLRHGGCSPDYCYPRLFRRGAGRFDESKKIHEKLRVSVRVGRLTGHFDHFSTSDIDQYLSKLLAYTDAEAASFSELVGNHRSRLAAALAIVTARSLPMRQKLSYLRPFVPAWPALSFVYRYVFRLGFLDGRLGFRFALLSAVYEYVWRMKARDLIVPMIHP